MLAKKLGLTLLFIGLFLLASAASLSSPAHAAVTPGVTIDSPVDGASISTGVTRFSGTYAAAYDVKLFINGESQVDTVMIDPEGDDSGTWYYDLDANAYDGEVQVIAKASDIVTRYAVWSPAIRVNVNNPEARLPEVTIVSPTDGETVSGTVPVRIAVASQDSTPSVQVRISHGAWLDAVRDGADYVYNWNADGIGNRSVSLEAKATDARGHVGFSMTTYVKVGAYTNEPFYMPKQDRAMWIWEPETYKLLLNPNSRTLLDAFAWDTATFGSDPITTFYLAVGSFAGMDILEDDPGKLHNFIDWAHQRGYAVQACIAGGTTPPFLGAYEAYHDRAIREIERVINYNLAAGANERFDGVNVDIEPYSSEEFKTKYPSLQLQYLDGLQKMKNRIQTAGINLPFGPAIPKWYDSNDNSKNITWNGSTKWLSEHVQDISDYISIMDYRDTADGSAGIIAGAQGEIDYANAIGKPNSVVIGVETKDIANSGDPETITFQEEGRTVMEAELDKVYTAFNDDASFGGIAMHHYDDIRKLPSYWGAGGVFWTPPADMEPPGAISGIPTAKALDYQQIQINFGMAIDNSEIDRYIVYRSRESGFTPGAGTVAGLARSLSFLDIGLLSNTTYYYRVAAMDLQGNIGPASAEATATTGNTILRPLIVTGLNVTSGSGKAAATMKVMDQATLQPIVGAGIEGRFHFAGGSYKTGFTDSSGTIAFTSESIPNGQQVGFEPRRVTAPGYYWAQAYDQPHMTALYPQVGLSGLTFSSGSLSTAFSTNQTSYTVKVPNSVSSICVTPTALTGDSVIAVNGQAVVSGSASQSIALNEGETTLTIVVTGRTGVTDTYLVKVSRAAYVDNVFTVTADTYVYENNKTANYGDVDHLEVVDIPGASGGGDRISYMKFEFGAYAEPVQSAELDFYVGETTSGTNNVEIYVYDSDNWAENTMNWNNRLTGTGAAKLVTVNMNHVGWYNIDVTGFVSSQMLLDKTATFRFLPLSQNLVKINSKENAVNKPYIVVNPSPNAGLRSLSLNENGVSPGLDGNYAAVVPYDVDAVTVSPVADEPHAQIEVNDTPVVSGESSSAIPLIVGENLIAVAVTAQNEINHEEYVIHVMRQAPADEGSYGSSGSAPAPGARLAQASSGDTIVPVEIKRITGQNGEKVDAVTLNQALAKQLLAAASAGAEPIVRIRLDTESADKADAFEITMNLSFTEELTKKQTSLELISAYTRIELSLDALRGLKGAGKDAIFRMEPVNGQGASERALHAEAVLQAVGSSKEEAKVIGQPLQIEANYTGIKTKLHFSLTGATLDLGEYTLAVYIEHSDGDRVLREGIVDTDANGKAVGIDIEVEKFSTFTIVQLPKVKPAPFPRYVFGYADGTFRPEQQLSRAELASMLNAIDGKQTAPQAFSGKQQAFADVPDTYWAAAPINSLTAAGIFEGRAPDRFAPDEKVTRAELAAIAARWNGLKVSSVPATFVDATGHWAAGWIAAGSEQGWLSGYPDGTFQPNREVTRAEAVVMINRMTGRAPAGEAGTPTWKDVPADYWAYGHIEAASR
ncbi:cadherin-like beta sandwich domain-containing protein [Paenibacillus oryzisoli]|uniref:CBM96 family carbohydrate-binding protein n=1 Tax=Paenibacillus oryzisoli TaxID=1850517 RepID=UPI003D2B01DD